MPTAAAYIRVSTEDQLEFSPDSQRSRIADYAAAHGYSLPEEFIFVDEGISGRSAQKRPAFLRMVALARLEPRPFDVILVWKFSRFARNRQDSIFYKSMLRKDCGIDVISITEQLSEDPTSILIEALLEAMDEYYSINLAQEVRRGMQEKFSRGGIVSPPPIGYRVQDGQFVIDEPNASLIRRIFAEFLRGHPTGDIAAALNRLGLTTSRGNPFQKRSVEYILKNPVYAGQLQRDGILTAGNHPALISQEDFQRVQEKLSRTLSSSSASHTAPAGFLLRGLVRCSSCGALLTCSGRNSLQCQRYAKGLCKVSHCISRPRLEKAVLSQLAQDLSSCQFSLSPNAPVYHNTTSALVRHQQQRLQRIQAAYEAGVDTLEEYERRKREVLTQLGELQRHPTPVQHSLKLTGSQLVSLLSSPMLKEDEKNELLRCILAKIIWNCPERTIQLFYRTAYLSEEPLGMGTHTIQENKTITGGNNPCQSST